MTLFLKQSTSIKIRMGPYVDATDGFTPETGLTIGAADEAEVLKANGAATVAMTGTFAAISGADGWYDYTVATGDVDTVGEVVFALQDLSVARPVFTRGYVLEEVIYDALMGSGATGELLSAYAGPYGPGIYLNDAAANTNTVNGVDGTIGNPVSTIAAAKTLADSMSLDRIYLLNDTAITLAATMQDYEFVGIGEFSSNVITLGSQDVDHSHFINCTLTGVQGGALRLQATNCDLLSVSGLECTAIHCAIAGTLTVRQDSFFDGCWSATAGSSSPTLDINSVADININWRHYSGGLQIDNAVATTVISYEADGQLIIDSTCTGLTITIRGNCSITDNGTSSSITQDAAVNRTNINAEVDNALDTAIPGGATTDSINERIATALPSKLDALFITALTESYAADGAAPTVAQALIMIQQMLGDFAISGTTLTVRKVDGATTAATFTLDSASEPTSLTRAT